MMGCVLPPAAGTGDERTEVLPCLLHSPAGRQVVAGGKNTDQRAGETKEKESVRSCLYTC